MSTERKRKRKSSSRECLDRLLLQVSRLQESLKEEVDHFVTALVDERRKGVIVPNGHGKPISESQLLKEIIVCKARCAELESDLEPKRNAQELMRERESASRKISNQLEENMKRMQARLKETGLKKRAAEQELMKCRDFNKSYYQEIARVEKENHDLHAREIEAHQRISQLSHELEKYTMKCNHHILMEDALVAQMKKLSRTLEEFEDQSSNAPGWRVQEPDEFAQIMDLKVLGHTESKKLNELELAMRKREDEKDAELKKMEARLEELELKNFRMEQKINNYKGLIQSYRKEIERTKKKLCIREQKNEEMMSTLSKGLQEYMMKYKDENINRNLVNSYNEFLLRRKKPKSSPQD